MVFLTPWYALSFLYVSNINFIKLIKLNYIHLIILDFSEILASINQPTLRINPNEHHQYREILLFLHYEQVTCWIHLDIVFVILYFY
jgi:hypothetical protein